MVLRKFYALIGVVALLVVSTGSLSALAQSSSDTEVPSYVDDVTAVAGDEEVTLSWDAATDDTSVTGYKVYYGTESVSQAGQTYNLGSVEVSDVLTTTVSNLENDITYYFAVTALDATENESLEYSAEVSATPSSSSDDGNPPSVVSSKATSCTTVELTFSEPVKYPTTQAGNAFEIEDLDTLLYLEVQSVAYGSSKSTLVLTTDTMNEGSQYFMTVGVDIEDNYGNAIVSGTSDTGTFSGVACAVEEPDEEDVEDVEDGEEDGLNDESSDTTAPALEEVEVISLTELELTFDSDVVLPEPEEAETETGAGGSGGGGSVTEDPALELFEIFDDNNVAVEILTVEYKETAETDEAGDPVLDETVLVLTTSEQTAETEYFLTVTGLADAAGNETTGDFTSAATYVTPEADEESDTIAPSDVSSLIAEVLDLVVNLTWESGIDEAGDAVDQILYVSSDGGATYEKVGSLGDVSTYSFDDGEEGKTYQFKVTTVDEAGNESAGSIVTAVLPTTGMGLGLLAAASALGGGVFSRKKKK